MILKLKEFQSIVSSFFGNRNANINPIMITRVPIPKISVFLYESYIFLCNTNKPPLIEFQSQLKLHSKKYGLKEVL